MDDWKAEKEKLAERIYGVWKEQGHVSVGIDGRCASGKTTLGEDLQKMLGGNLLHMDDFFLRPEQRTPERYAEPGGNVDRERFREEVLRPLQEGKAFAYRPFDCQTMSLKEPVQVQENSIVIVEGSYCLHPDLRDFYDLKVFLDVDSVIQMKRIRKRNPDKIRDFQERWIPYEEKYFDTFHVKEKCDVVLNTGNAF